ncbi:hypothetical protein Hanom_Chr03g00255581 [Helianthus anomalus]
MKHRVGKLVGLDNGSKGCVCVSKRNSNMQGSLNAIPHVDTSDVFDVNGEASSTNAA